MTNILHTARIEMSKYFLIVFVFVLFCFFRRVNTELALKCRDADLLILEGMGR